MIVYRLSKKKYCKDLSGRGAEEFGGRWNSKGTPMIYTSESRALCTAEVAVHFPLGIVPDNYYLVTLEIAGLIVPKELLLPELPENWKTFPHAHETQQIGDDFVSEGVSLVLKVPSAVIQGDFNYLINPRHQQMSLVKIIGTEPFSFDKRLFKA